MATDLAQRIKELGLAEPALLFLEGHRPLSFLGSQVLIFASPFLGEVAHKYAALLEDPSALQSLILELRGDLPSAPQDRE
ncbi:MAG: hypothetical protein HYX86_04920 [Chloroflexi bacterium]|nr:hypothetical protein [Chloroflexota bacterium]